MRVSKWLFSDSPTKRRKGIIKKIMFCNNCGKELSNEARFCGKCGTPIVKKELEGSNQQQQAPIISSKGNTSKRSIWRTILKWIIGVWAVLTLAGGIISIFGFLTVGMEITFAQVMVWILALAIILKLNIFKSWTNI